MVWKETKQMTELEIAEHHKDLAQLAERIEEVTDAAKRNPWSRDIAFLERRLAEHWNKLVAELAEAGINDYKPRAIAVDEKPVPLTWLQQLFVETGQTPADLTRKDEPKNRSAFGDGLTELVGY
jgi:hypothetical protein